MNSGVQFHELKEVLAVVASFGVVIRGRGQPEIGAGVASSDRRLRYIRVEGMAIRAAAGKRGRQDYDGPIETHLDLEVRLCSTVVGACTRRCGSKRVRYRPTGNRLLRQKASYACTIRCHLKAWEHN